MTKKYTAIEKTLAILDLFSVEKPALSIKEISEKLLFNTATIHRILSTLVQYGYLVQTANREYCIGTKAVYLSAIYTQSNYLDQIRPVVNKLRDITSETSSFFIEEEDSRICLYRAHSYDEIRHNIEQGTRLKLNRGASGRVILAYGKRKNDKYGLFKDIRNQGYYLSINEHNPSLFSIAVPVIAKSGKFVGALVVSGPISRFNQQKEVELLAVLQQSLADIIIP
jgi:DNA-binding IclR family transcriptional regulator